jgi:NTP pyrophosphatase (non-canonical NTP hydrolase)
MSKKSEKEKGETLQLTTETKKPKLKEESVEVAEKLKKLTEKDFFLE